MKINNIINDNIENIIRWIDNYLPFPYSDNIKLPEINIKGENINIYNNNFNFFNSFSELKNQIFKTKKKIDLESNTYMKEIKNLKNLNTDIQESNIKYKKFLEILYNNIKFELNSNFNFNINKEIDKNIDDNDYTIVINDLFKKLINIINKYKINNNENVVDILKKENDNLKNEFKNLKNILQMKEKEIENFENLQNENINLKEKLNKIDKLQIELNQLNEEIFIKNNIIEDQRKRLEKKENLIYNYNKNKNLNNNNNNNNSLDEIAQLNIEKENLVKDNILLIKENGHLKKKINYIQNQLNGNNQITLTYNKTTEDEDLDEYF